MKILMISPEPFFQPRGTPLSILHRLIAVTTLGHEVDLLTYSMGEEIQIPGVTVLRIPALPFVQNVKIGPSYLKVLLDLLLFVRAFFLLFRKKYDLIYSHEEASFFSTFLSYLFRTKHLYDMHSSLPQQLMNFKFSNSKIFIRLFEVLERLTINRCDALITICPELEQYVRNINPQKKLLMIENTVDTFPLSKKGRERIDLRRAYGLDGKRVILYTGNFEPYQGLELLLESARIVISETDDVLFMLVGGKEEQIKALKEKAIGKGISGHLIFTGTVPFYQMSDYIEMADILVSPRIEGNNTPLKIYSYLRSGRPIVATNLSTHTQVLNSNVSVLTDPNALAFAEGILNVLKRSELGAEISERANELAREKYSYDMYLEKTKQILDMINA